MKKSKNCISIFLCLVLGIFLFAGCSNPTTNSSIKNDSKEVSTIEGKNSGKILVHYIDVGQGDSILVQVNNKNLLIDAGPRVSHKKLMSYLKSIKVKNLDYFITTHPHEDHIGGASYVIDSLNVKKFYAPKKVYNTETYKHMISSLKSKNLKINVAKAGVTLNLGDGVICEMLSPNKNEYKKVNNYSPIIKLVYKNNKFMFTGDAEALAEQEVLSKNYDISSDVLKLGHHGSVSSTTPSFLKKVHPKIAIASCGKANKYGHPHKETVAKIKKINCKLYRTDINGNILILGDGNNLKVKTEKK